MNEFKNPLELKDVTKEDNQPVEEKKSRTQKIIDYALSIAKRAVEAVDISVKIITNSQDTNTLSQPILFAQGPIRFGFYVIIIFIGLGGTWVVFAPLDSAAPAMGMVIANSKKQVVQTVEGGILKTIHVTQGTQVTEGDPIVDFDESKIRGQYDISLQDYRTALATEARLIAERDNSLNIEFPEFLLKGLKTDPKIENFVRTQENLFRARREGINNAVTLNKTKISQILKTIDSYRAKKNALQKNLAMNQERMKATEKLVSKGFATKSAMLDIQSRIESYKADLAETESGISKQEQEISKIEIEILNLKIDFMNKILHELKENHSNLSKHREEYFKNRDMLERTVVRSPVTGIVNRVYVNSKRSVINQHSPIAEITPINDALIIEAYIDPKDIASITEGLTAKVKFSAFKSRTSPVFKGKVTSLSPDIVEMGNGSENSGMRRSGQQFYVAKIEINMQEFNKYAKSRKLKLLPGMQAEIQIVRGSRTLLRYLLDPLLDQMFNAFTEK